MERPKPVRGASGTLLVALVCAAQVLVQIGAYFWLALVLRALAGIGWAGTYMTGLNLLADQVDAKLMSRAAWGAAFLAVAVLTLLALVAFWLIRPRELAGDRGAQ